MSPSCLTVSDPWVALSIGNTHWRWGYFDGDHLLGTWTTPSVSLPNRMGWDDYCKVSPAFAWQPHVLHPPLFFAGVVQASCEDWLTYPQAQQLTLDNIPIQNLYPTLGIDRAIALFGAGQCYGWPVLVIDGGTALTYSGSDATPCFQGGAIAPGLGVQLQSLHQNTDALPALKLPQKLPLRWALSTEDAILSGVLHGLLGSVEVFISDWNEQYPISQIVFTGGDGEWLFQHVLQHYGLKQKNPYHFHYDEHLILKGIGKIRQKLKFGGEILDP